MNQIIKSINLNDCLFFDIQNSKPQNATPEHKAVRTKTNF